MPDFSTDSLKEYLKKENPTQSLIDDSINKASGGAFIPEDSNINGIYFDILESESFSGRTEYTSEVTEFGYDLSRSGSHKPREITFTGKVANIFKKGSPVEAIVNKVNSKISTFNQYLPGYTSGTLSKANELVSILQSNISAIDRAFADAKSLIAPFDRENKLGLKASEESRFVNQFLLKLESLRLNRQTVSVVAGKVDYSGKQLDTVAGRAIFKITSVSYDHDTWKAEGMFSVKITVSEVFQTPQNAISFQKKIKSQKLKSSTSETVKKGKSKGQEKELVSFLKKGSMSFFGS